MDNNLMNFFWQILAKDVDPNKPKLPLVNILPYLFVDNQGEGWTYELVYYIMLGIGIEVDSKRKDAVKGGLAYTSNSYRY